MARVEQAASQCITAASVGDECKRILSKYPREIVQKMQAGDVFCYMECISTSMCADVLLSAKVCHLQTCNLSNSLETSGEEPKQLATLMNQMTEIARLHTAAVMTKAVDALQNDFSATGDEQKLNLVQQLAEPANFKNFCKLAKMFEVDGWSDLSDTGINTTAVGVADAAHVRAKTALAEADLQPRTFAAAAQGIHKLGSSKAVRAAKDFVAECNSSVALPDKMKAVAAVISNLHSKLEERPELWCRSLRNSGHTAALLTLDASIRANLGAAAEGQLRLAQVVEDARKPKDQQPDIFALDKYEEKATVNNCVVHLIEISTATSQGSGMDDEQLKEVGATRKLGATLMSVAEQISQIKKSTLGPAVAKLEPLQEALKNDDSTTGTDLCKKLNDTPLTLECSRGT
ncbi:unnamed protein product [Symbiodinium sp. CCMP2592]|nr:unnamed protein product [Symbiodinium sp. CCMP2592]